MHGIDNAQVCVCVPHLHFIEVLGDDANNPAASLKGRVCQLAHHAHTAAAVDKGHPLLSQKAAQSQLHPLPARKLGIELSHMAAVTGHHELIIYRDLRGVHRQRDRGAAPEGEVHLRTYAQFQVETAAQLVSYGAQKLSEEQDGFLGFAAVDGVKFRGSVSPGQTIIMVGKMLEIRKRRCVGATQGFVDGTMVYEGLITGMWI